MTNERTLEDSEALDKIAESYATHKWDVDALDEILRLVLATGREVAEESFDD